MFKCQPAIAGLSRQLTAALPVEDGDVIQRNHPADSVSSDAQEDNPVPNFGRGQEGYLEMTQIIVINA